MNYYIYCLQETHFTENMEPYICAEWGVEVIFNSYTSNARGVCILLSTKLKIAGVIEEFNNDTCILCGDFNLVKIRNKILTIIYVQIIQNRKNMCYL